MKRKLEVNDLVEIIGNSLHENNYIGLKGIIFKFDRDVIYVDFIETIRIKNKCPIIGATFYLDELKFIE